MRCLAFLQNCAQAAVVGVCAVLTLASVACGSAASTSLLRPAVPSAPSETSAEVLLAAVASDWRPLDPEHTLDLELPTGRVVIELAPTLAPAHVANILALAAAKFWDGAAILRVQDNYVVQWGDPTEKRDLGAIDRHPPANYSVAAKGLTFTRLPDGDVYAEQVGWSQGFPVARDATETHMWPLHCYSMVGVGRDMPPDAGTGAELYTVIGHAPRHLDRNLAVVGRIVAGMELLTALARGKGKMGFYETEAERVAIRTVRVASQIAVTERVDLRILRTDTVLWQRYVNAKRWRRDTFFVQPSGRVDICNVLPVVRPVPK